MRFRENAICIRTTDYSETSQVVHFFTRNQGTVKLLAKGTKRPKSKTGGMIDLLADGDLVYSSSGRDTLGTLMEFSETTCNSLLRKDAARLSAALYMIELAGEMFHESDPHPEAFDLLHNALARLSQEGSPVDAVLAYFQWRLLEHCGLLGNLSQCVSCSQKIAAIGEAVPPQSSSKEQKKVVYFSSTQGGLLCGSCGASIAEKLAVADSALTGLAVLLAVKAGKKAALPQTQAQAINRLLAYHIAYQLGKRPKMAKHAIG